MDPERLPMVPVNYEREARRLLAENQMLAEALAASEAKVARAWDEGWKSGARDQMTGRALTENPHR